MTCVVVGDTPESASLLRCLKDTPEVVRWADIATAFTELKRCSEAFSWAFIDAGFDCRDIMEIVLLLRARDPSVGICLVNHYGMHNPAHRKPLLCALENGRDGTQRLRCALQGARLNADRDPDPGLASLIREVPSAIGYIAPMNNRRRS